MKANKNVIIFSSLTAALVASVALTGCSNSSTPSTTTTTKTASDNKVDGGDIIYGSLAEPSDLNPFFSTDTASTDISSLIFDTLYNMNDKIQPYPQLADGMPQISADGKVWTVKIKPGVKFSDGQPLTADDVVFTFSIPINKDYKGPRKSDFDELAKVEKVDDTTVKFTLKDAYAPFLTNDLSSYPILPQHLLKDVAIKDLDKADFNKHPVGSGPMKFVEWKSGQYVKLARNENYFLKKPSISTITYKVVPDANALVAQLESGEINMTGISPTNLKAVKDWAQQSGKVVIDSSPDLAYNYIGWNLHSPFFKDVRVRQAMTMALDRQAIVDNILNGNGKVANTPASNLMTWAFDDNAVVFPYDMDKAKQLLADAGWKPGPDGILQKDGKKFSFEMLYPQGNKTREQVATYAQQQYKKLGIEVKPRSLEWSSLNNEYITPGKYDAALEAWYTGTDPDPTAIFSTKSIGTALNFNFYSNPQVDKLDDENVHEMDQTKRGEIIKQAEHLIEQDQPYTFLYYPNKNMALPSNLKGVDYGPIADLYNVQDWYFTK